MPEIILYNEDCFRTMQTLSDKSINMVMTSPPYWALRDYGKVAERIWGGLQDCKHNWGKKIPPRGHKSGKPGPNATVGAKIAQDNARRGVGSNFCLKCGAWKGQLGLEPTFDLYIKHLCDIFDEVKRVLRDDGTCWVNIGDTYGQNWQGSGVENASEKQKGNKGTVNFMGKKGINTGVPPKSLIMIPFRFAIEMVNRDWILRNTIIWKKNNCMPSSAKDRFTVDFEYLFFFSKKKKYYFEQQFDKYIAPLDRWGGNNVSKYEGKFTKGGMDPEQSGSPRARNKRTVWTINTKPFSDAHFAVYPQELCETPIKAGCSKGGIVYDPFCGSGTTGEVAHRLNRNFIGSEISTEYYEIAKKRLKPFINHIDMELK